MRRMNTFTWLAVIGEQLSSPLTRLTHFGSESSHVFPR
jgi:hypothetical protein